MSVIAIVNRKGGSGKSTLATHIAARLANDGQAVMLGDIDPQQSTQTWLRLRSAQALPGSAPIVGWAVDPRRVLRPPAGIHHVILDTPGGLRGFDLARVAAFADLIVMPVCNSVFDRESAAACHAELMALPRVACGRCKVAAIGMRLDARTKAAQVLEAWAAEAKLPFLGVLRETQIYVRCVEEGLSIFDLPASQTGADRAQWQPILAWLDAALRASRAVPGVTVGRSPRTTAVVRTAAGDPSSPEECTAATSPLRAGAAAAIPRAAAPAVETPPRRTLGVALGHLLGRFAPLAFLQRNP